MIEVFRLNHKWRIKIVNETLEFKNNQDFTEGFNKLLNLKLDAEPYK